MSDDAKVLDFLRVSFARLDTRLDGLSADIADLKMRLSGQESATGNLLSEVGRLSVAVAGTNARIDRIETRLERIERRLDPVETT